MQFESVSEWIAMGGHGAYVWSAYGISLALLAWNALVPGRMRNRILQDEIRRRRREEESA